MVLDWIEMLVRWLHLITGIAWVGASFYFVWLDNHIRPSGKPDDEARGVHGELWSVHGGGFYHSEKFLQGPRNQPLPSELHWFKWEAYWTWLSGMGLLALVYWLGAPTYLIDPAVAELGIAAAISLSAGILVAAWVIYDLLCRILRHELVLGSAVALLVLVLAWALFQLFSGRAAALQLGAAMGSIMVANVFFVIIPGQKQMVAALREGRQPDPQPGRRGKQRSVHNTYFTLPVLLIMISSHYPAAWSGSWGWAVLTTLLLAGVLIRQFFVVRHSGRHAWWMLAAAAALIAGAAWWVRPPALDSSVSVSFEQVQPIIEQHCNGCHASAPTDAVFTVPPLGLVLETRQQVEAAADLIYHRTVVTRDMPFLNATGMSDDERALVAAWYAGRDPSGSEVPSGSE